MAKTKKKTLTKSDTADIILSESEARIILNLRRIVEKDRYGSLTAVIDYHDGTLSKGRIVDNELKL